MATAFVTGGSGFIGGRLIERLRAEGWDVRALARSEGAAATRDRRGAEPVSGDLEDLPRCARAPTGSTAVFHAAAKAEDWGEPGEFEPSTSRAPRTCSPPPATPARGGSCTWAPRRR